MHSHEHVCVTMPAPESLAVPGLKAIACTPMNVCMQNGARVMSGAYLAGNQTGGMSCRSGSHLLHHTAPSK